jgi:hypothetical protein
MKPFAFSLSSLSHALYGMDEVRLCSESFGDFGMYCKLPSVVEGDGSAQESLHVVVDAFGDMVGQEGWGFMPGHCPHGALVALSDDGVAFPVPEAVLAVDCRGPVLDADPSGEVSPVFTSVPALPAAAMDPAKAIVEVCALALVPMDKLVDGLVGGHRDAFLVPTALGLSVASLLFGELPADRCLQFAR